MANGASDYDTGSTPTLFTGTIEGAPRVIGTVARLATTMPSIEPI